MDKLEMRKKIYENLPWILTVLSAIIILISKIEVTPNVVINDILEKLGIAMFSSGVFAAVLKSIQFTGLFKEEIEKVILGTDFIKNRRDLPDLWRGISKEIYKQKFPQISSDLENRILNTYFPTKTDYYYLDYMVTINIEKITDDLVIHYTQTCKYTVITDENTKDTHLTLTTTIKQVDDAPPITNNLNFVRVNNQDVTPKEDDETVEDEFVKKFIIPLKGEKTYNIYTKYTRSYSLKNENYKLFRMNTFTKNMDVVISFPEDVCVSFFNIGNVTKFEKQHVEVKNQICRSHRNDVILPHQGFGMSFEKRNKQLGQ